MSRHSQEKKEHALSLMGRKHPPYPTLKSP